MAEQFCLKWNNHQSTLISNFDSLLETQKHVDCSLSAEGRILRAHKVVLSACSPYLEQLLNHERDKYPVLVFSDVKYDYLKAMLDYMYRGEVNVLQEHLNGFLKAAETLQIKGLTDQGGGGEPRRKQPPRPESPSGSERPSSPTVPAKRRRQRRPSQDLSDGLADATSNSCDIPTVLPAPVVTKQPKVETDRVSNPIVAPSALPTPPPSNVQPKLEPVDTPPVVQPKTEYVDDVNDEQIEDLTLDDDDDDSYMAKPGSSHGNDSQGFDPAWQFGGEASNQDMFMGTQDPTGNQNNSQDLIKTPVKRQELEKKNTNYSNVNNFLQTEKENEENNLDGSYLTEFRFEIIEESSLTDRLINKNYNPSANEARLKVESVRSLNPEFSSVKEEKPQLPSSLVDLVSSGSESDLSEDLIIAEGPPTPSNSSHFAFVGFTPTANTKPKKAMENCSTKTPDDSSAKKKTSVKKSKKAEDAAEKSAKKKPKANKNSCSSCSHVAESRKLLKLHKVKEHDACINTCPMCNFTTKKKQTLEKHMTICHTPINLPNMADLESKAVVQENRYTKFKCPLCTYSSLIFINVVKHINKDHRKTKLLSCLYCIYQGPNDKILLEHMTKIHNKRASKQITDKEKLQVTPMNR